jgi:hypothetical protein
VNLAEVLGAVGASIGIVLGLATLGGLLVRYALLPWLQTHIVSPVQEVNRQVTVNGHVSEVPTLLDRVDNAAVLAQELRDQVDTVRDTTDDLESGQQTLGRMLDGHLDRSAGEWGRIWEAIAELRALIGAQDEGKHHG